MDLFLEFEGESGGGEQQSSEQVELHSSCVKTHVSTVQTCATPGGSEVRTVLSTDHSTVVRRESHGSSTT